MPTFYSFEVSRTVRNSSTSATFRYFRLYRPNPLAYPFIVNNSDIILFDFGLHYVEREMKQFRHDMLEFTSNFLSQNKQIPLIWRGTSAQSWNNLDGYYDKDNQDRNVEKCVPFDITRNPGDLHLNEMKWVHNQTRSGDRGDLRMIPFREYTSHFFDLHSNKKDCTHFCYVPSFWLYLWRALRLELENIALERKRLLHTN
jgi:hypothetical protein